MFKLLRRFSVTSFIAFIIVAIQGGNSALERLEVTTPAAVVLDLHLPKIPGENILRQIRADTRVKQTRVMLATVDPARAEAIRAEANLVFLKPVAFGQLRDLAMRLHPADNH